MTGLGASIYVGFFALAALWLFLTSDGPLTGGSRRSGPAARPLELDQHLGRVRRVEPWLVSHSSLK